MKLLHKIKKNKPKEKERKKKNKKMKSAEKMRLSLFAKLGGPDTHIRKKKKF